MRVAVIGGAGYIGSHVVLALIDAGHEAFVYDDLSTGLRANVEATGAEFTQGDILDQAALDSFFSSVRPEAVVHLAAKKSAPESDKKPLLYAHNNIGGTINVLSAMASAGTSIIVFSSTAAVYGDIDSMPVPEDAPCAPTNFYGFTKLEAERIISSISERQGFRFGLLRYFNAAGYDERITARQSGSEDVFSILGRCARGQKKFTVFGTDYPTRDGTCVRDFVHPMDLAEAHVKAIEYLSTHDSLTVNLGSGDGQTVSELVSAAKETLGPFQVSRAGRRPGDIAVSLADISCAKKLLGWRPDRSDIGSMLKSM